MPFYITRNDLDMFNHYIVNMYNNSYVTEQELTYFIDTMVKVSPVYAFVLSTAPGLRFADMLYGHSVSNMKDKLFYINALLNSLPMRDVYPYEPREFVQPQSLRYSTPSGFATSGLAFHSHSSTTHSHVRSSCSGLALGAGDVRQQQGVHQHSRMQQGGFATSGHALHSHRNNNMPARSDDAPRYSGPGYGSHHHH